MKRKNKNLFAGLIMAGITIFIIILGFFWTPYEPDAMNVLAISNAPSFSHLFGTDNFGRDLLSRVMEGSGTTFYIAFLTVLFGGAVGTIIGGITGYFGGLVDEILMRINDTLVAFPSILLALVMISIMGSGMENLIIVLSILFIPSFARVTRGEFARQKEMDYVKNARLMGVSHGRIIFVHILPNIIPVLLSSLAIGFNNAVLAEATMSFLSLGVSPTERASLGYMLLDAQPYLFSAPWQAISIGLAISFMILSFNLISEGLGSKRHFRNSYKRKVRRDA